MFYPKIRLKGVEAPEPKLMWQKIKRGDQDGGEILVEAELFLVSCQQVTRWLRLDGCVYTPCWVKLFLLRLHRFVPLSPWHHVFFNVLVLRDPASFAVHILVSYCVAL